MCGSAVQLLHKLVIRATNGPDKLMEVIRNPIESHFPAGAKVIGPHKHPQLGMPYDANLWRDSVTVLLPRLLL